MTVTIEGKPAFPKRYMHAADLLGKDVTLTIASIKREGLRDPKTGETVSKWVIRFQELAEREGTEQPHIFVINETNAALIATALKETEATKWPGRKITLYSKKVRAFGDMVPAIRVRDKEPKP